MVPPGLANTARVGVRSASTSTGFPCRLAAVTAATASGASVTGATRSFDTGALPGTSVTIEAATTVTIAATSRLRAGLLNTRSMPLPLRTRHGQAPDVEETRESSEMRYQRLASPWLYRGFKPMSRSSVDNPG
jgi:hypothetical protein